MQKSLLTFFTKTPKSEASPRSTNSVKREDKENVPEVERLSPVKTKKKRLILDSSDEEEENKKSPVKRARLDHNEKPSTPRCNDSVLDSSCANLDSSIIEEKESSSGNVWTHLTLDFLKPDQLRDKYRNKVGDESYDYRTLFVPEAFLRKQTPGMRQWWELKTDLFDTILCFKVGKFYELYHMDAVVGVEQLGLSFMRGAFAHSGFPEVAFQRFAETLVHRGYKVARIEQTESADAMSQRTKNRPGNEKVVRREVCQIITPGTALENLRASMEPTNASAVCAIGQESDPLLLAIKQRESTFGVAILDAKSGEIAIGQFADDRHLSRLRTTIAHYPPSQIICARANLAPLVLAMLRNCAANVPMETLKPGKQFLDAQAAIGELDTNGYFDNLPENVSNEGTAFADIRKKWPPALFEMLDPMDVLGRGVKPVFDLACSCLGAVIYYLRYCLIDREILTLGRVTSFHAPDETDCQAALAGGAGGDQWAPFYARQRHVVLDGITLANLDVLRNSITGTVEGTMLERLDKCSSPFGRRLLRKWISAPLCRPDAIRERQAAVTCLVDFDPFQLNETKALLKKLPDLERLLTKVHVMSVSGASKDHPESRAVIYEELSYSKSKIVDFVTVIEGFKTANVIMQKLREQGFDGLLRSLVTFSEDGGRFPRLDAELRHFCEAFDHERARKEGRIVPEPGVDEEYDEAVKAVEQVKRQLDEHLNDCIHLVGHRLVYWGTGRNRFQIEVPDSKTKAVPRDWQISSQRKGFKRYKTAETTKGLASLMQAEDRKDLALRDIMRRIFAKFSKFYQGYQAAVTCLAELDCLLALAQYSRSLSSGVSCVPEFVELKEATQAPMLLLRESRHPCLTQTFTGSEVIPNDVLMGIEGSPSCWLVTGPNMGGKSTLMRQAALITLIAHLGCHVPAEQCRMTPVDRIFTRLGASDRLLAGESTFLVELAETGCILRHATANSLILMDELGRGTSTHDGSSLAGAVLEYLACSSRLGHPRTLFSTHYHSLVGHLSKNQDLKLHLAAGHMACMVEKDNLVDDSSMETITFLYKFVKGVCPKSYGFNAARLAHLPDSITRSAIKKANQLETVTSAFTCLRDLVRGGMTKTELATWKLKLSLL